MKTLYLFMLLITISSCVSKKYTKMKQLPDEIRSATEIKYLVKNDQKLLLYSKQMNFTKNGRIKNSVTTDTSGKVIQTTQKKLWFIVETYPDKENYYCKTRWKPNSRERISCYTRKQIKQNEAIYTYNPNGTINTITDHYPPFYTKYHQYANQSLSKIIIKDKNNILIDKFLIHCIKKDERGSCLQEIRTSTKTNQTEEYLFIPKYH
ncbi:hypothetical protein [Flavobacterium flavipallidum]|uniref:YD repeat-containing protein n=1 Tax=Flavobacterium flavipallidum TaxID=3139140 RepID=A0ABU9HQH5_9FLAO